MSDPLSEAERVAVFQAAVAYQTTAKMYKVWEDMDTEQAVHHALWWNRLEHVLQQRQRDVR